MEYLDELIIYGTFIAICLICYITLRFVIYLWDLFVTLHGLILFIRIKRKGKLHERDNKFYIWWKKYKLSKGSNPYELGFESYEAHFVNGTFIFED